MVFVCNMCIRYLVSGPSQLSLCLSLSREAEGSTTKGQKFGKRRWRRERERDRGKKEKTVVTKKQKKQAWQEDKKITDKIDDKPEKQVCSGNSVHYCISLHSSLFNFSFYVFFTLSSYLMKSFLSPQKEKRVQPYRRTVSAAPPEG